MKWLVHLLYSLKVRDKFILAILANILLVLICFAFIIDNYQQKKLAQKIEEKNISLARNMASEAVDPLLVRDFLELDALVKTTQQTLLCKYAYLIDQSGKVVAHTDKNLLGEKHSLPQKEEMVIKERVKGGITLRDYYIPVVVQNKVLGYAVVGIDKYKEARLLHSSLHELRYTLLIVSVALFMVAVITSSFLASRLTKRLGILKDKMREVQKGDLQVQLPMVREISCVDMFNCPHKDCPAASNGKCWTREEVFHQQQKECLNCDVYKEVCADEIGELHMAFNQMVQNLRLNLQKLEQANLEKNRLERLSLLGQMSAQVAHEIKNPLNSIKGAAHYIKTNFQGQLLQEFLEVIEEESQRLSDILADFLNFSKPGPLVPVVADLNSLVQDTLKLVENDAQEKGVSLHFNPDEPSPKFNFDYAKMKQSLLNLLINALQATPEGERIEVSTEFVANKARIVVSDTGKGMTEKDMEQIFRPFYTTKMRGSGLGLAIAEQSVREHEGDIQVQSSPEQGTAFTITLPLR